MTIKTLCIATLIVGFTLSCLPVEAQFGGMRNKARNLTDRASDNNNEGNRNRNNDVEGGIWEYKVIDPKGDKKTVLSGKIRIKGSSAFDVRDSSKGSLLDEQQKKEGDSADGDSSSTRPKLGIADRISENNRGAERIGDVERKKSNGRTNRYSFEFDTDDDHILSGNANAKLDTRNGGNLWRGDYFEEKSDGKKEKWKFEIRWIKN